MPVMPERGEDAIVAKTMKKPLNAEMSGRSAGRIRRF
jgi:hypothetical protein